MIRIVFSKMKRGNVQLDEIYQTATGDRNGPTETVAVEISRKVRNCFSSKSFLLLKRSDQKDQITDIVDSSALQWMMELSH